MSAKHVNKHMPDPFSTIEALVDAFRAAPSAGRDFHTRAVLTGIDPMFPQELHGFPVFHFDEDGKIMESTGNTTLPYVFAINEKLPEAK